MRSLIVGLGLVLASTSFAAKEGKAPFGNGNFRRAEVVAAVGGKVVQTKGISTIGNHSKAPKGSAGSRIIAVQHSGTKVSYVEAPLNKGKEVRLLTDNQVARRGLVTQAKAKQMAELNSGNYGTDGHIKVKAAGLSNNGSLTFDQVSPATVKTKLGGEDYTASKIRRYVSITGAGESATAGNLTPVNK